MNKVILIGLDGFRPEMLSASIMPNLQALTEQGAFFRHHRAAFPSETYVSTVSILTGQPPGRHGIVANSFFDPDFHCRDPWLGSLTDMIDAGMAAYDGRLITAPTLGDHLGRLGKRMWVFSGNSPGSALLKHPTASRYPGHIVIAGQDLDASLPRCCAKEIARKLGPPPVASGRRDTVDLQRYLTDAFLHLVESEGLPEASVIWYGEPDHSFHFFGLGDDRSTAALVGMDAELGRLVDWWQCHPERETIQIIITSDHGHITQEGRVDTLGIFTDAGFKASRYMEDGAEMVVIPGNAGNVRLRTGDPGRVAAVVAALMASPDIGLVFTKDGDGVHGAVPGTFALDLVGLAHPRSPDITFTLRTEEGPDAFGFAGTGRYDGAFPVGAGNHGGLHPVEMSPLLIMAGVAFGQGVECHAPSSVTDLLPTILSLLDIDTAGLPGRILSDASAGKESIGLGKPLFYETHCGDYRQELTMTRFAGMTYLDAGRRL